MNFKDRGRMDMYVGVWICTGNLFLKGCFFSCYQSNALCKVMQSITKNQVYIV